MHSLGKHNNMIQELQILGNDIQIGLQMITDRPNKHGQDQRMAGTCGAVIIAVQIPTGSLRCTMFDDIVTSRTLTFF